MAHAILISDHDFLNDTMKVNLQSYLSCKIVIIKEVQRLRLLLEIDQTYDFILCLTSVAKRDVSKEVYKIKSELLPHCPLFFLGHLEKAIEGTFHLQNPFEVLSLVRTIAKELKWSAQDIIKWNTDAYIPVSMRLLKESKIAIDDLYWKTESSSDPFVLVANHQEDISNKLKSWDDQKIVQLYIRAENRLRAMSQLNATLITSIQSALEKPELQSVDIVAESSQQISGLFTDPESVSNLPEEIRAEIGVIATKTSELVSSLTLKVPNSLNKIIQQFQKSPANFIPRHSFLTTYFALEMIKKETWYSSQVNEKVCMLLFFHDIILLPLYNKHKDLPEDETQILESKLLNDKEKQVVTWHASLIAQMMSSIPGIPVGLDQLVMQHHGTLNGSLNSDMLQEEVSLLAKVVIVAEAFVLEVLKAKLPLTNETKLEILKSLEKRFTKRSYFKLISSLEKIEV